MQNIARRRVTQIVEACNGFRHLCVEACNGCFDYIFLFNKYWCVLQDYDPKGTGVLRADDVPVALGSAIYLFKQKMDSAR